MKKSFVYKCIQSLAKLVVTYRKQKKPRKPGAWSGKVAIAKDFDKLPPEFMKYFK